MSGPSAKGRVPGIAAHRNANSRTGLFLSGFTVIAILTVTYRHWLEHRGSGTIAEFLEEAVIEGEPERFARPTVSTTPEEMAHARPDLLTGELKPKVD